MEQTATTTTQLCEEIVIAIGRVYEQKRSELKKINVRSRRSDRVISGELWSL